MTFLSGQCRAVWKQVRENVVWVCVVCRRLHTQVPTHVPQGASPLGGYLPHLAKGLPSTGHWPRAVTPKQHACYRGERRGSPPGAWGRQRQPARAALQPFLPLAGSSLFRPSAFWETCHLHRSVSRLQSSPPASGRLVFLQVLYYLGEENEMGRGLIFIEGSLCARNCALHYFI